MSTDPDLSGRWRLHPQVALRPERFGALAYHFGSRRLSFLKSPRLLEVVRGLDAAPDPTAACRAAGVAEEELPSYRTALATLAATEMIVPAEAPVEVPRMRLVEEFEQGLDAPICITWELTYACNLACVHCLSSSGRRDPRELTTAEAKGVIEELERMQVFYVNVGGGEPTVRRDFWELLDHAAEHNVGVKFSTNGSLIDAAAAARLAASDYVDVQVSIDGATAAVNDAVRGPGSFDTALGALERLAAAGFERPKISVVVTRQNAGQLDEFKAIADRYGAQLRITRLRPSGRGADVWDELHPTADQQRSLYTWLLEHGEDVLTGDSFFHLSAYGEALPGLNLCGAGRVVCLIDPVGDVYACPFTIHEEFLAGNVREPRGFEGVWRDSELFNRLRAPQSGGACESCGHYEACRGGCMAAKFFTGLPLDGPDPECALGHGEGLLEARGAEPATPAPAVDHSRVRPSRLGGSTADAALTTPARPPAKVCDENPLADFLATVDPAASHAEA